MTYQAHCNQTIIIKTRSLLRREVVKASENPKRCLIDLRVVLDQMIMFIVHIKIGDWLAKVVETMKDKDHH